jgi:hypothetical protein
MWRSNGVVAVLFTSWPHALKNCFLTFILATWTVLEITVSVFLMNTRGTVSVLLMIAPHAFYHFWMVTCLCTRLLKPCLCTRLLRTCVTFLGTPLLRTPHVQAQQFRFYRNGTLDRVLGTEHECVCYLGTMELLL